MLLDEYEGLGLHCDPQTQLVVTCEVCRRPATKECWTCGMQICEFCTLKRHWKVMTCLCRLQYLLLPCLNNRFCKTATAHSSRLREHVAFCRKAFHCCSPLVMEVTCLQVASCLWTMLQSSFPLHWPLINSDNMRTKLAKRELERKRIEDDQRSASCTCAYSTGPSHSFTLYDISQVCCRLSAVACSL